MTAVAPGPSLPLAERVWIPTATLLLVLLTFGDLLSQLLRSSALLAAGPGALRDVCLAVLVVTAVPRWRSQVRLLVPLAVVLIACLLAALLSPGLVPALKGFRGTYLGLLLLPAAAALAASGAPWSGAATRRLLLRLIAIGQVAAITAVITWTMGVSWLLRVVDPSPTGTVPSAYFVAGSIWPRAFSPFVSPNTLGAAMVVVLLATLALPGLRLLIRCALLVLPMGALVLSQSRSAWLGLVLGSLVLALTRPRVKAALSRPRVFVAVSVSAVVVVALALCAGLALAARSSDPSARGHVASLQESLAMLGDHPWGYGLGMVGPRLAGEVTGTIYVESSFLLVGLEIGVLGLLGYLAVLGVAGATLARRALPAVPAAEYAALGLAVLVGTASSQFLLPTIQETSVAWQWWLVIGACLGTSAGVVVARVRALTGDPATA